MEWMNNLPERHRSSLEALLDSVNQHEKAYMSAENASVGQIWVAFALLYDRIEKLEALTKAQRKALNDIDADVDVDRHLDENLENSLKNY
ncbi:MAG: hypothetical protein ABEJ03_05615 [Candidatus Nanohaloarchaea archaeon]